MLAVLPGLDFSGSSPEDVGSAYECLSCPPKKPLRYLVFPPTHVNQASGRPYNRTAHIESDDRGVRVMLAEGPVGSDVQWVIELSPDLEPLRALPGDSYWPMHEVLYRDGLLDHGEDACVERESKAIRMWTEEGGWEEIQIEVAAG